MTNKITEPLRYVTAVESGDTEDLRDLRQELLGHGVVVREEGKRQYWRTAK